MNLLLNRKLLCIVDKGGIDRSSILFSDEDSENVLERGSLLKYIYSRVHSKKTKKARQEHFSYRFEFEIEKI